MSDDNQSEQREQQYRELIELIERCVDLKHWGFLRTYTSAAAEYPPTVIYDSELCRVRINHGGKDMYGRWNELAICYGRLHAPNNQWVMNWSGEECHCWHQVFEALDFLDGLSPQEAVNQLRVEHKLPRIIEQFNQSYGGGNQPERLIRTHVAIWENYGRRLFGLFDLHEEDLWSQYTNFVSAMHKIKGLTNQMNPALDKIC